MIARIPLALTMAAAGLAAAAVEFHVSPDGNDNGPGTEARPFAGLGRARDAMRAAGRGEGGTVWVHGGTYRFADPVEFTAEDSGAPGAPIVVRAVPGEEVWLSGGVLLALDAFAPVSDKVTLSRVDPVARASIRQIELDADVLARVSPEWPDTWWYYRRAVTSLTELFAGDRRLPMARWPDEGYTNFGEILVPGGGDGETPTFTYKGARPERWLTAIDDGLWLYGYWRRGYRAEFIRVKAIAANTRTIELSAKNSLGSLETGGANRYSAIHLLEELDHPGEWYLDRARGILYVWPPESPRTAQVVLSVNATAVLRCIDASHLEFRGFGIECAAGCGIRIEKGRDCRVVACEIRNVGTHGIQVDGDGHRIVGCDIHHTGDKAIAMTSGNRYTLTRGDSLIDNCHLHHTNRIVRAGSQAVSLDGVGNRFSHNVIHDTGYIAVRFAGNEHVLEYNRLFRTNVESAEGGVFYTGRDWTSRGSVIRHNFIHHVQDTQEGCGSSTRFVHLDDSAPDIEIHGNVCYRIGGGVSICGGAANRVHDNLFVECAWGVDIGPRGHDMFEPDGKGGFTMVGRQGWSSLAKRLVRYKYNQPPYSTRYPRLVEMFGQRPIAAPWFNVVTRNAMVQCGRGIRESGMQPGWSTVDNNWEGDDPGFVEKDHTKLDFRLAPTAAVHTETGFSPPQLDKIGLYASPDRRSWPVALDLPPSDWRPRWMHLRDEASRGPHDLPIFRIMKVTGTIAVDGVVNPMEWTPGDATGSNPEIHDTAELIWTHTGAKAVRPSQAMLQTDDSHLYVNFRNPIDPATGVSSGHKWGRDDAVEIALASVKGGKIGPTMVLRGYTDGQWESSSEAGAPPAVVERAKAGVTYAASSAGAAMWCAEWRIPFTALGVEPAKRNPRLVFNLSVRKPAGNEWVMWNRNGGSTCDVHKSGFLWLAQFGDMAAPDAGHPSQARIDIDSRRTPVMMTAEAGCEVAAWAHPLGCYVSATMDGLPTGSWRDMSFSFVPKEDGVVILKLMGAGIRVPGSDTFIPVWTYMDDLRVTGATVSNGDFEPPGRNSVPNGWRPDVRPGLWIHDSDLAASGRYFVKTSHNHRFAQELAVTGGQTVTVRVRTRGIAPGE